MYVVSVLFETHPEHQQRFRAAVQQQAKDSLDNETHCHQFDVCVDPNDASRFYLYEIYQEKAAFDAHLASEHFQSFNQQISDWVQNKHVWIWSRI